MTEQGNPNGVERHDAVVKSTAEAAPPRQHESFEDSASVLAEMLRIAIPSVATMSSYTVMQFADKLMVSRIGPEPIYVSAQSNGGILAWTLAAFVLGMTGVVNSFVSQNLGAGKPERGAAYAWNGLWVSIAYYAVFIVPAIFIVPKYFAAIHDDQTLVALESEYAIIILIGIIATMCSRTIHHYFYGLHRPWVVLISALSANLVNIVLNVLLIFGDQGLSFQAGWLGDAILNPITGTIASLADSMGIAPMGIKGAAYATITGGLVEFLIPLALFVSPKYARMFGTLKAWRLSAECLKGLWKVGLSPGLMFVNEIICWNLLMVWLVPMGGKAMGDDPVLHNTTGWIALQYMHLSFMPAVGLSIAAQAMVGKCMGMKRPDLASDRAMLALKITLAYMGICAFVFVIFREPLIAVFIDKATPPEQRAKLIAIGAQVMIAAAIFQLFDALAITTSAALRGAGDTFWPGVVTIVLSWVCIVGVGLGLVYLAPGLGSLGPWIGASLYIVLLGVALGWRFAQGKWKTLSLVQEGQEPDLDPIDEVMPDPTVGLG
ncbi:MAG: MATE family efflux transporter [Phycisphaerales bacterium JB052]